MSAVWLLAYFLTLVGKDVDWLDSVLFGLGLGLSLFCLLRSFVAVSVGWVFGA